MKTRALVLSAPMILSLGCAERPRPPASTGSSPAATLAPTATHAPAATQPPAVAPVPLPNGAPGVGFDDLRFSSVHGVLVPAGRSGLLDLVDPATREVTSIGGFATIAAYDGGHDAGITSVDEGRGLLFVVDHGAKKLDVVDPGKRAIVAAAPLAADPDYVRWVAPTSELWVTEPDAEQVEIFTLAAGAPRIAHAAIIKVPKGPESLVIDAARGRAYANAWQSETFAIDLRSRAVVATWKNTCKKSRGLAFDASSGVLFVGCGEGGAVALDVNGGAQLGAAAAGDGVDIIAYSPARRHLYVPGAKARTMTIMAVSPNAALTPLGTVTTAAKAHCVTTDDRGTAFVCDPDRGQLLAIHDPFPPSR